jgi:hypothetical protein
VIGEWIGEQTIAFHPKVRLFIFEVQPLQLKPNAFHRSGSTFHFEWCNHPI